MENKIKHIEIIQDTIKRMADNSFKIKGWCITIVTAIIGIAIDKSNYDLLVASLFPIILFWYLDAFFLRQEKLFRELYDFIRMKKDSDDIDFSMDTTPFKDTVENEWGIMYSKTLAAFYSIPAFLFIIFAILVNYFV